MNMPKRNSFTTAISKLDLKQQPHYPLESNNAGMFDKLQKIPHLYLITDYNTCAEQQQFSGIGEGHMDRRRGSTCQI